jgi:hypothetical protein
MWHQTTKNNAVIIGDFRCLPNMLNGYIKTKVLINYPAKLFGLSLQSLVITGWSLAVYPIPGIRLELWLI